MSILRAVYMRFYSTSVTSIYICETKVLSFLLVRKLSLYDVLFFLVLTSYSSLVSHFYPFLYYILSSIGSGLRVTWSAFQMLCPKHGDSFQVIAATTDKVIYLLVFKISTCISQNYKTMYMSKTFSKKRL